VRILVTAGAGFIGTALVAHFADAGHEVVCADRPDRLAALDARRDTVQYRPFVLGDDDGSALLDGCQALLHLAHRGLPSSPASALTRDAGSNVVGGLALLEAARDAGVDRVVYASSGGTVYGRGDRLPLDEAAPCAPISAYGATKMAMEGYLRYFADAHGMRAVSLRMGNAFGPGQFRGAGVGAPAMFLSRAAAGQTIEIWGDGSVIRDYVYVDDIVSAFAAATESDLPSGAYNVGSGVGHSLNQIVEITRELAGHDVEVDHRAARSFDVPAVVLDITKLHDATGWAPQVDLRGGMTRMWDHLAAGA
jgi:UDP-glucose 4-epimerase